MSSLLKPKCVYLNCSPAHELQGGDFPRDPGDVDVRTRGDEQTLIIVAPRQRRDRLYLILDFWGGKTKFLQETIYQYLI